MPKMFKDIEDTDTGFLFLGTVHCIVERLCQKQIDFAIVFYTLFSLNLAVPRKNGGIFPSIS